MKIYNINDISTNIYKLTSNQSNPVQQPSNALKEVSIDVDQLIELNKNDLNEFKNSGFKNPAEFLKQNTSISIPTNNQKAGAN